MADLNQLCDYNKRISRSVEDQLTKLMEVLTCGINDDEYIGADGDDSIECDIERIAREAIEEDMVVTVPMR